MSEHVRPLQPGARVVDRDADPPRSEAVVLGFHTEPAEEIGVPALGKTVAEANPDYAPNARVAAVAFVDGLRSADIEPAGAPADVLEELAEASDDVTIYDYPAARLEPVVDRRGERP